MFRKVSLFVFAVSLLLAGCAQKDNQPAFNKTAIKNVAVASSFGPYMYHTYMGLTIYSNQSQEIDGSTLNLDGTSRDYLVSQLRAKGYNAVGFNLVANDNLFSEAERQSLLEQARAANYDTLIIMDASSGLNNLPSEVKSGYGLFTKGGFGIYHHVVYNGFSFNIYNVTDGQLITSSKGYPSFSWNGERTFSPIELTAHPEDFMAFSDSDKQAVYAGIERKTKSLIDFAITETKL